MHDVGDGRESDPVTRSERGQALAVGSVRANYAHVVVGESRRSVTFTDGEAVPRERVVIVLGARPLTEMRRVTARRVVARVQAPPVDRAPEGQAQRNAVTRVVQRSVAVTTDRELAVAALVRRAEPRPARFRAARSIDHRPEAFCFWQRRAPIGLRGARARARAEPTLALPDHARVDAKGTRAVLTDAIDHPEK